MLNRIRNHAITPMGRGMFIKRIIIIELIEILGTYYYYTNFRKLILSLSKAQDPFFIAKLITGAVWIIALLEFYYVLRRLKDIGKNWMIAFILIFLWKYSIWIKIVSLLALCIIDSVKRVGPVNSDNNQRPVVGKITIEDKQDINVSDFENLEDERASQRLKELSSKSKE